MEQLGLQRMRRVRVGSRPGEARRLASTMTLRTSPALEDAVFERWGL